MVRKKPKPADPQPALFVGLTPNQVVAYNLTRARELKGWTQDQAAEALEPYLGVRWSKASVSQAERSVAGGFVRNFTADEIVAFARAFNLPVTWFFMPQPPWAGPNTPTKLDVADASASGHELALLVDLVFGDDAQQAQLAARLDAFLADLGPTDLTQAQTRITSLADQRVAALVRRSFTDLARWQTSLRSLATHLEDLEARAKRDVADEVGLPAEELGIPPEVQPAGEPAEAASSMTATAADSPGTPADIEGDQPAPPNPRTRRPPSTTKRPTKRKS
jgi:transcriptional regulator with XRE-family HTH domain